MITRFDPFQDVLGLRDAMNQLLEDSFVRPTWRRSALSTLSVPVDVFEMENGYQVKALLPGVKPEEVEMSVLQNTLIIKGQVDSWVKPEQQGTWLAQEIRTGAFERSITFPKAIDADRIESAEENGMLSISVPFSEGSRPRKISIAPRQSKQMAVEAGAP